MRAVVQFIIHTTAFNKTRPLKNYNSQITISKYFNSANKSANSTTERQDRQTSEKEREWEKEKWEREEGNNSVVLLGLKQCVCFFLSTILLFPREWPVFLSETFLFIKSFNTLHLHGLKTQTFIALNTTGCASIQQLARINKYRS